MVVPTVTKPPGSYHSDYAKPIIVDTFVEEHLSQTHSFVYQPLGEMVGFFQLVSLGLGLWLVQRALYVYKAIKVGSYAYIHFLR